MIKRMIIMLILLALVAGGFVMWKVHAMHAGMAQMAAGFSPPTVSTVKAEILEWQPKLESIGTLRAINGTDLSAEVAGIVETLSFDSGADVEKDALLVQLRAEDDAAKLQALEATEKLAQVNLDRDMKQLKVQAVSQASVDSDNATLNNAKAQVDAQQAILDKKTIRAPFSGHVGIRQVDIGQYLNPGTTIVTLQQLDPIYVDFSLPEQSLPKVLLGQKVTLKTDAYPDKDFIGKIAAINSKIDETTRNIVVRAVLDNPDHTLLPGMFGHISVDAGQTEHFITLPQTAIVYNTYGNSVFLVQNKEGDTSEKPQKTVVQTVIITGETRGDQIAVTSGIKEGDEVVTSGQIKLRNGMSIVVSSENQPPNDANPTPHEQ